jgi:uncharacterized membrane protein YeaQ/YmgE (transglycosylase-associated protein family)
MKKGRIVGIIGGFVAFATLALLGNLFKSSIINILFLMVGLLIILINSYFFFDSKKILLYTVLGIIFSFSSYFIFYIFVKPHPGASIVPTIIFTLVLLIATAFFIRASFEAFKNLLKKGK